MFRPKMFLLRNSKVSPTYGRSAIAVYSTIVPEKCPFQGASTSPSNNEAKKVKLIDTEEEYAKARPVSEMPGPSTFELIKNMILPSGKYYKAGLKQIHQRLFSEYGNVVKFPGMFGRNPMVFLYDADQVEKVFRNEGQWPDRRGFEYMIKLRQEYYPDLYKGIGGLVLE